jgi:hypothetical protein
MIHHISIAAEHPQHVAQVLAEIFQGKAVPFPHNPGSYMAVVEKDLACVQVYPIGTQIIPGSEQDGCNFVGVDVGVSLPSGGSLPLGTASPLENRSPQPSQFTPFHAAIFVPISQAEIERIGAREGWRVVRCRRGGLVDVLLEFWVENRLMLELVPPEMMGQFLAVA